MHSSAFTHSGMRPNNIIFCSKFPLPDQFLVVNLAHLKSLTSLYNSFVKHFFEILSLTSNCDSQHLTTRLLLNVLIALLFQMSSIVFGSDVQY